MSQQAHTPQAAIIADPLQFARDGGSLAGRVPVADLERLRDLLAQPTGEIAWEMRGSLEEDSAGSSRMFLDLDVSGELQLVCQRCLGPCAFPLSISSRLELMPPGQDWPEEELEDDSCDAIEAARNLLPLDLVEDELLLALPQSPRHENCSPPGEEGAASGKPSPFAALAALKKSPGSGGRG